MHTVPCKQYDYCMSRARHCDVHAVRATSTWYNIALPQARCHAQARKSQSPDESPGTTMRTRGRRLRYPHQARLRTTSHHCRRDGVTLPSSPLVRLMAIRVCAATTMVSPPLVRPLVRWARFKPKQLVRDAIPRPPLHRHDIARKGGIRRRDNRVCLAARTCTASAADAVDVILRL